MIVQIQDRKALSSISIVSLRAYLNSRGWTDTGIWGERPITVFAKEQGGRTWEVLVPHRDTIGGYAENMAESVAVLAEVEEQSQLDVFYELTATSADVIRVRSANGMATASLSLRQSAGMLNDAYRMLESGARAAEKPRAIYRGKLSADVAEYLDSVHPLPGYSQGYALTLHSPVPVEFDRQGDLGDDFRPPFSRLVTITLAQGLRHSSDALEQVMSRDTLEPFREAVESGVSANLCDSLAELTKQGEGIAIDLTWAGVRPSNVPDSIFQFSPASADILTEAAKSLRRREPSYDERIIGLVVRLEKEPMEFDGKATIASVWDGRLTRMDVEFEQAVYNVVIGAFRDQTEISLDGDIYPSGRGYELRNPRNLTITPET